MKLKCRFCEREITTWKWTSYLRAHKWTEEQARAAFPGQPVVDLWCPAGRAGRDHE